MPSWAKTLYILLNSGDSTVRASRGEILLALKFFPTTAILK